MQASRSATQYKLSFRYAQGEPDVSHNNTDLHAYWEIDHLFDRVEPLGVVIESPYYVLYAYGVLSNNFGVNEIFQMKLDYQTPTGIPTIYSAVIVEITTEFL